MYNTIARHYQQVELTNCRALDQPKPIKHAIPTSQQYKYQTAKDGRDVSAETLHKLFGGKE